MMVRLTFMHWNNVFLVMLGTAMELSQSLTSTEWNSTIVIQNIPPQKKKHFCTVQFFSFACFDKIFQSYLPSIHQESYSRLVSTNHIVSAWDKFCIRKRKERKQSKSTATTPKMFIKCVGDLVQQYSLIQIPIFQKNVWCY